MNTQDTQRLQEFLDKDPIITIIPHTNPDGDAIGSSLGLYLFLKAQNHNVKVITPTDFPDFLKWMPAADDILIYPNHEKEAQERIESSTLIFTLDFNNLLRAKPLTPFLEKATAPFVMIDHHQQPDTYATITYSNDKASSTCELVYHTIVSLASEQVIDEAIATYATKSFSDLKILSHGEAWSGTEHCGVITPEAIALEGGLDKEGLPYLKEQLEWQAIEKEVL